jgi:hypothetical protein
MQADIENSYVWLCMNVPKNLELPGVTNNGWHGTSVLQRGLDGWPLRKYKTGHVLKLCSRNACAEHRRSFWRLVGLRPARRVGRCRYVDLPCDRRMADTKRSALLIAYAYISRMPANQRK